MRAASLLSILAACGVLASPAPLVTPAAWLEQRWFGRPGFEYEGDDNEYYDELEPPEATRTVYVTKNRHRPCTHTLRPRPQPPPLQHPRQQQYPNYPQFAQLQPAHHRPIFVHYLPNGLVILKPHNSTNQTSGAAAGGGGAGAGSGGTGTGSCTDSGTESGTGGTITGSGGSGTGTGGSGTGSGTDETGGGGSGTGRTGGGGSGSGGASLTGGAGRTSGGRTRTGTGTGTGSNNSTGGGCAGACTNLQVITNPGFDATPMVWTFTGTNGAVANVSTTVGIVSPGGALASAKFTFLLAGTTAGTAQLAAISRPVTVCEKSTYLLSFSTYVNQGINTDSLAGSPVASAITDIVQSLVGTTLGAVSIPLAALLNCQIAAAIGPSGGIATHTQTFAFAGTVGGLLTPNIALGGGNVGWNPNTYNFTTAAGETADLVTLTATCPGLLAAIDPNGALGTLLGSLSSLLTGISLRNILGPDLLTLAGVASVQIYVDNVTLNLVNACT